MSITHHAVLTLGLAIAHAGFAHADIVTVPLDYPTIQEAITASGNGDTILVEAGTYFEALNFQTKNLILESIDGAANTIIDGSLTTDSLAVLINCNAPARINGFTFRNADGGTPVGQDGTIIVGGGIRVVVGAPIIENCIFEDCESGYGGGIHADNSTITIRNCTFTDCFASANAGAVLLINGTGTVEECIFTDNRATLQGGAMHIVQGNGHALRDCSFTNSYAIDGGAISWQNTSTSFPLEITDCIIEDNNALNAGGGIRTVLGSQPAVLTGTTVCDNTPDEIVGPYVDDGGNVLCICPADINGNGIVEVDDVLVIVAQYGTAGPQGDIDWNGVVDVEDLLESISTFGPCENP